MIRATVAALLWACSAGFLALALWADRPRRRAQVQPKPEPVTITLRRCPSPVVLCTDEGRMARFSSMAMQGRALRSCDVAEVELLSLAVPVVAEHVSQYGTLADLSNRSRVVA